MTPHSASYPRSSLSFLCIFIHLPVCHPRPHSPTMRPRVCFTNDVSCYIREQIITIAAHMRFKKSVTPTDGLFTTALTTYSPGTSKAWSSLVFCGKGNKAGGPFSRSPLPRGQPRPHTPTQRLAYCHFRSVSTLFSERTRKFNKRGRGGDL